MEKNKFFSVLMSVYKNDNAKFFVDAVESCYNNQDVIPTEIVIVEDGPLTEELYSSIDHLKKKHSEIKSVKLEKNAGLGKALETGLTYCSNELIARLDSDDLNAPNRFKVQLEEFDKDVTLDVVGTFIEEFYTEPGDVKAVRKVPLNTLEIKKFLKRRNPMNHVTVMMKKSAVMDVGNYETVLFVEDYYLWIKLISANKKIVNIPFVGVFVRTGDNMYGRRSNKEYISSWKILQKKMKQENLISSFDVLVNMIAINIFIRIPVSVKEKIYTKILRRKEKSL